MVSFGLSLPGNNTIATSQQELRYRGLGCPVLDAFQGRVLGLYPHAYWIDAPLRTIPSPLHPFQLLPPLARRKSIRRIDSQQTVFPCCVKRETAPRPVLRMGDQFSLDRVQVHVVQQERPALEKRQGRGTLKFQIKAGPPVHSQNKRRAAALTKFNLASRCGHPPPVGQVIRGSATPSGAPLSFYVRVTFAQLNIDFEPHPLHGYVRKVVCPPPIASKMVKIIT